MKGEEQVLLYQFREEERCRAVADALENLGIRCRYIPEEAYNQKIGYLLGLRGFHPTLERDEDFIFPHEVVIFQNIKGKRLDEVLERLKAAGISRIKFKAVVTPFNTLWTLQRLCETMQKEYTDMVKGTKEGKQ